MLTVATQIEAPAKFLWAAVGAGADAGGRYPFSVLGLGDVVVPGAFVGLLRELDKEQGRAGGGSEEEAREASYFQVGLGAYAAGLLSTFAANYLTKSGQPALVYIVPSLLLSAVATAASRGELPSLLEFESPRAAAAKASRDAWREEKKREREEKRRT